MIEHKYIFWSSFGDGMCFDEGVWDLGGVGVGDLIIKGELEAFKIFEIRFR